MCFNIKVSLSKDKAKLSSVATSQRGTEAHKLNRIKKPPHKICNFMSLHSMKDLRKKGKNKRKGVCVEKIISSDLFVHLYVILQS